MESIVFPPDDGKIYTRRAIIIRSFLIFIGYIFIFLATASEIRDVLPTFLGVEITPRQALLIISLLQIMVWLFWGFYPLYKDQSLIYVGYFFFVLLFTCLSVETDMGTAIFGNFAPGFRVLGTMFIIVSVMGAAGSTSIVYYSRNDEAK